MGACGFIVIASGGVVASTAETTSGNITGILTVLVGFIVLIWGGRNTKKSKRSSASQKHSSREMEDHTSDLAEEDSGEDGDDD